MTELILSSDESDCLKELESVIESGMGVFLRVGNALLQIREDPRKLYRAYGTFEDYCKIRWQMGKSHAYRMIEAAKVCGNLSPMGDVLPENERQCRPLAGLSEETQREVWQSVLESTGGESVTEKQVQKAVQVLTGQTNNVHVSDESYEWYTPKEYMDAVRCVLGVIDLDPASTEKANEVVRARQFFTTKEDGIKQEWCGRVYLNPPYSMPDIENFVKKAIKEWHSGRLLKMVILTNNSTDTEWFHLLAKYCRLLCFTKGRINFWKESPESSVLATRQGQVFFFFGNSPRLFTETFRNLGLIAESRIDY